MNVTDEFIPTRASLLSRLKDWRDDGSWREFFETYWKLMYSTAKKWGLSDDEAQEAVQETVISVMKGLPKFKYRAVGGSFKKWLLKLTQWRIMDQLRKRGGNRWQTLESVDPDEVEDLLLDKSSQRAFEAIWDEEWEKNIVDAALERVKKDVDPSQYQIFDLAVVKGWPATKITATLRIGAPRIYLAKHRISKLVKREIEKLKEGEL